MTQILLVSKGYQVLQEISRIGSEGQFSILESENAFSATELLCDLGKKSEKLGCVIVDEVLPDISGKTFCRMLAVLFPKLPLVLLTAGKKETGEKKEKTSPAARVFTRPFDAPEIRKYLVESALPTITVDITPADWKPDFTDESSIVFIKLAEGGDAREVLDAIKASCMVYKCSLVKGAYDAAVLIKTAEAGRIEKIVKGLGSVKDFFLIPFEVPKFSETVGLMAGAYEQIRQDDLDAQKTIEVNPLERAKFVQSYLVVEIDKTRFEKLFIGAYLMEGISECYPARGLEKIVCLMNSDSFSKIDRKTGKNIKQLNGVLRVHSYNLV